VSVSTNGWTEQVDRFNEVTYQHEDDSEIYRNEGPQCRSKPWALAVSDPPVQWGEYETPEAAMTDHAEGEWREHMRSRP
jgi:hypothetical protein